MSARQSSRSFGATNASGTCLWCGKKLRVRARSVWALNLTTPCPDVPAGAIKVKDKRSYDGRIYERTYHMPGDLGGDYRDGCFCGLRCGYDFGRIAAAALGVRLHPTATVGELAGRRE